MIGAFHSDLTPVTGRSFYRITAAKDADHFQSLIRAKDLLIAVGILRLFQSIQKNQQKVYLEIITITLSLKCL